MLGNSYFQELSSLTCRRAIFVFFFRSISLGRRKMALVIICGQPCSGKSTAAACLVKALEKTSNMPVILIDEPSLNLDRNNAYQGLSLPLTLSPKHDPLSHGMLIQLGLYLIFVFERFLALHECR